MNSILDRHKNVFGEELGTLQGFEEEINVDPTAKPVFCKDRSVPYAKVKEELERLVKQASWSLWSLQSGLLPLCQW